MLLFCEKTKSYLVPPPFAAVGRFIVNEQVFLPLHEFGNPCEITTLSVPAISAVTACGPLFEKPPAAVVVMVPVTVPSCGKTGVIGPHVGLPVFATQIVGATTTAWLEAVGGGPRPGSISMTSGVTTFVPLERSSPPFGSVAFSEVRMVRGAPVVGVGEACARYEMQPSPDGAV